MDTILAFINQQNIENVLMQELVDNNPENVDVNFIRNYLIFTNWRHRTKHHVNPHS